MAYTDYAFYTGTYRGNAIAQADFPRLAMRASEVIDQMTFSRAAAETDTANVDKIKLATCALAEQLQTLEASGGVVSSESVGGYSVSYLSQLSEDARLKRIAKRYLASTGLMFAGFNQGEGGGEERHRFWGLHQ